MKIECITVCVNYADFLREMLPYTVHLFDDYVVVTSPNDGETKELCRRWSIRCLVTDDFTSRGDEFCKGRGIQRGLDSLSMSDWVLHLDADMALPSTFRQSLEHAHLQTDCVYGVDRIMVQGEEAWKQFKASNWLTQWHRDYHCRVTFPDGYAIGSRWASPVHGFVPIGAFQLWHGPTSMNQGTHSRPYPQHHSDAARGDIQHGLSFDRRKRVLLPEVVAVHLESEPTKLGANWQGRKTKRFGSNPIAEDRTAIRKGYC